MVRIPVPKKCKLDENPLLEAELSYEEEDATQMHSQSTDKLSGAFARSHAKHLKLDQ